ncbi:MAG: PilT/PilU family type 4a pilus ATPase [Candidatus Baltobacteraceae bacterium]
MSGAIAEVRLADLIHTARSRNASDIHFSPNVDAAIRVDGGLEHIAGPSLSSHEIRAIASTLIDGAGLARAEAGEDVSQTWNDGDGLIRVHAFRADGGLSLSLRLLNRTLPSLEELRLPPVVSAFARRSRGLVLFAGPTGSGKSTSLAAIVDRINSTSSRRILTIEDPIEYRHTSKRSSVVQREIGRDAPTFEKALVGALRADPDIIVVGEMRESATMRAALTAAETGHLVLATLHTGDAVQTIDRIVDAFSGPAQAQIRAQLAQVLVGVVCQHLVRSASGAGRRLAAEVLVANDAARVLIREMRTHQLRNVILTGRDCGMQTLEHHLGELMAHGEIAVDAAMAVSDRSDEIRIPGSALS